MDVQKLKIRIGDHEFEAEGPADVVQAQFAIWRDLVTAAPTAPPQPPAPTQPLGTETLVDDKGGAVRLEKITKVEGRIVSLTARGASLEDEIMLVLFGQKSLRDNDAVTGGEVLDGLRLTGRTIKRVDYQLDKLSEAGDAITIGVGRARRYRLTNQGLSKAREIAQRLIATVA